MNLQDHMGADTDMCGRKGKEIFPIFLNSVFQL